MKLVISSLFIVFLLLPITNYSLFTTHAQTPIESGQTTTNYQLPATVSPTSPIYTDLLVYNLFHTFSCLAVGQSSIGQPCLTYKLQQDAQGAVRGVPVLSQIDLSGGTLGGVGSIIEALYVNPPIRTTSYLSSVGQGLGIIKEAHAQVFGSGARVLDPILKLWQFSRNIAYVIMIIIFIIIGLMVMFRQRINPQTVITAQAAIPGLVIGLILITFSYFLAALITDVAFIGTNVVGYYFSAAQGNPPQNLVADISNESVLRLFSRLLDGISGINNSGGLLHAIEDVFNNVGDSVATFMRFAAGLMAFQYGNQLGHIVPVVGDIAGIVGGLIAVVGTYSFTAQILTVVLSWIIWVILIYSMLKLLLRLINNYLNIIFLTITAPFQFLAASLPGRQSIATAWILNMLCNILAFPAVAAVLYFVAYLLNLNRAPFQISGAPGLISGTTLPLFGGFDAQFINTLLGYGALIALPAIPDIICRTIGRVGAAGQLLGQEISGNIAGGRGYANQGQQIGQIGGTIGRQWDTYRGRPPGWSPAWELHQEGIKLGGFLGIPNRRFKQGAKIPGAAARSGPPLTGGGGPTQVTGT